MNEVRDAGEDDLDELLRLESYFVGDRLTRRQFRRFLSRPTSCMRVLQDVATARLYAYALTLTRADSQVARLYSLVVDPAARGCGLGLLMLCDAEQQSRKRGASALRLEVREDNSAALALYRGAAYLSCGRTPAYYDDGCAALRLQKML